MRFSSIQRVGTPVRRARSILGLTLAAASALGGCGPASPTLVPQSQQRSFHPEAFVDAAPAGWTLYTTHHAVAGGGVTFLSNVPLPDPCPAVGNEIFCYTWPPVRLPPDGIVVRFDAVTGAVLEVVQPPPSGAGQDMTINGLRTRLVRADPGTCATLGGSETLSLLIPTIADWTGTLTLNACLRGPDLSRLENQLVGMVRAVTGN